MYRTPKNLAALLAHIGLTRIRERGDEIWASCPNHKDSGDSWSINQVNGLHSCFGGETEVMTADGIRRLGELVGTCPTLLTSVGWVRAPVRWFGRQPLWRVTIQRNGVRKMIRATSDHRWMVRVSQRGGGLRVVERLTSDLLPGHRLGIAKAPALFPERLMPEAVGHGFVFGDGTKTRKGPTRAYFYGSKAEIVPWFPQKDTYVCRREEDGVSGGLAMSGLPAHWKDLPARDSSRAYLFSWLAGYFAADGCVDKAGTPILSSARKDVLEYVRDIACSLGIVTYGISTQERLGKGRFPTDLHHIRFGRSSLPPSFFLRSLHRERATRNSSVIERPGWVVVDVERTNEVDDVFCATVRETGDFSLADNLLVGNCFGCGYAGSLTWLVMEQMECDNFVANRLIRSYGGATVLDALEMSSSLEEQRDTTYEEPYKRVALSMGAQFQTFGAPPVDQLEKRHVSPEISSHLGIRWKAPSTWILPIKSPGGVLLGWEEKAPNIVRDRPTGVKTSSTVFGAEHLRACKTAILVESPLDAAKLRTLGYEHSYASFGAVVSDDQMRLLSEYCDEILLALDHDAAGTENMARLASGIRYNQRGETVRSTSWWARKRLLIISYAEDDPKDVGDMSEDRIAESVANATPANLWLEGAKRITHGVSRSTKGISTRGLSASGVRRIPPRGTFNGAGQNRHSHRNSRTPNRKR